MTLAEQPENNEESEGGRRRRWRCDHGAIVPATRVPLPPPPETMPTAVAGGQIQHELEMLHQQMEEQGYVPTPKDDIRKVKEYTRQNLFGIMKFITSKVDLYRQGEGSISKYVMDELHIKQTFRKDFWEKQAPVLKSALNQRRANCSTDIGKVFVGKFCSWMQEKHFSDEKNIN